MDATTFDRLTQLFTKIGNRRSALSLLLGTAMPGTWLAGAAAVPEPLRHNTRKRKGRHRGKKKRKGHRRARAQGKSKPGNHCISPSTGADLNELFGISEQIVTSFCSEVGAGERWTTGGPWFMAQSFESVPEEFVPAGDTPLEDFVAKFTAIKFVIDPGSKQEEIVVFPKNESLFVDTDFQGFVFVSPTTLGLLHPEPVGHHVVDVFWVFSAMHCDGIDDDLTLNCFPAGETKYIPGLAFTVTPGHN